MMANKQRCWLFTEIEDEKRITQGNAGYDDETGVIYRYDNSVPNHKNPAEGDVGRSVVNAYFWLPELIFIR
jgi:hypothetical protein